MHKAERYAVRNSCASKGLRTFFLQNMGSTRKVFNVYVGFLYGVLDEQGYQPGDEIPPLSLPEVSDLKKEYPYLKEADSLGLANAKQDFQDAVKRFNSQKDRTKYTKRAQRRNDSGTEPLSFRGLCGMPKFHAKSRGFFSYTTNCQYPAKGNNLKNPTIRLSGDRLRLPKWKEDIILVVHRPLPEGAVIKSATVSMDIDGKFFVSLAYEYTIQMDMSLRDAAINGDASVLGNLRFLGLDYSNPHFYVDSEGRKANCPDAYWKSEERLARLQRQLSRMEKGSANYKRQLERIRKLHKKIRNQRKDFVCKEAAKISSAYDVVVVEDIDLRAMSQTLRLAKGLLDNGFGMFRDILARKLEEKGSVLVRIDRWYPSSKTCGHCGHVEPSVKLGVSQWDCPVCGTHHDRDHNAAMNIREEGKRIFLQYYKGWLEEEAASRKRANALSAARRKKKLQPA